MIWRFLIIDSSLIVDCRLLIYQGLADTLNRAINQQSRINIQQEINNQESIIITVLQRTQPAGTFARRASSWISLMALVCAATSFFTRSSSATTPSRCFAICCR